LWPHTFLASGRAERNCRSSWWWQTNLEGSACARRRWKTLCLIRHKLTEKRGVPVSELCLCSEAFLYYYLYPRLLS
jgi:hypothetical protein